MNTTTTTTTTPFLFVSKRNLETQCEICIEDLKVNEHLFLTTCCNTYYHKDCLKVDKCPHCRATFSKDFNQPPSSLPLSTTTTTTTTTTTNDNIHTSNLELLHPEPSTQIRTQRNDSPKKSSRRKRDSCKRRKSSCKKSSRKKRDSCRRK